MCGRDGRDEHGRFKAGASGNPDGRPARKRYTRLLEAAEAVGARVVVEIPTRRPRPSDEPPRAA